MNLTLNAIAGDDIRTCCEAAQRISNILEIPVQFDFNGVSCVANPHRDVRTLEALYMKAIKFSTKLAGN